MSRDSIRGKSLIFTFEDGPMANKSVEHTFDKDGGVSWKMGEKSTKATKCEIATIREGVQVVSYLGDSGYTLTVILDFKTGRLTAFSSNEKELGVQHGTFEVVAQDEAFPPSSRTRVNGHSQPHSRH